LKYYQNSNAEQDDLWAFLTAAAREDGTLIDTVSVKDIMDTWTLRKGYPVVTVARTGNQIRLTQKWFLLNPLNTIQNTPEYNEYKWYIPFTFTTKDELNYDFETAPRWFMPEQPQRNLIFTF
jgi:aminopeptidase N